MYREFEVVLANHCAPMLFGKKPAVLLAERKLPQHCAWKTLREHGFHVIRLHWRTKTVLTFLYHPKLLMEALSDPVALDTLSRMGYSLEKGLSGLLNSLRKRFALSDAFPHEVGFFLGYPAEDVVGFMACSTECKLCGQWKVYGDEKRAAELFEEYARCKKVLLGYIERGGSIFHADLPALAG